MDIQREEKNDILEEIIRLYPKKEYTMSESNDNKATFPIWLKTIGEARDSILTLSVMIYILGYIVWSLYAWQNGMGLLPVLDSQYLIAGIVPFILTLIVIISTLFITNKLNITISSSLRKIANLLFYGISFVFSIFTLGRVFFGWDINDAYILIFLLMWILIMNLIIGLTKPKTIHATRITVFTIISSIITLLTLLYFYVIIIFPSIPQSLGGPRPRCAYLEVNKDALSTNARDFLLVSNEYSSPEDRDLQTSQDQVVRTLKLDVLLVSDKSLLVKLAGSSAKDQAPSSILELKQDLVKAIQWCD